MTALTVPTLVVAGPFAPSVSVLPLGDKQAMVPCPEEHYWLRVDYGYQCRDCGHLVTAEQFGTRGQTAHSVPFVSGPIHIAHQCPECDGEAWFDQWARDRRACPKCNSDGRFDRGSGWVYRSAQAEQGYVGGQLATLNIGTGELTNQINPQWELHLSGVSSETSPYLGDVSPGWHA